MMRTTDVRHAKPTAAGIAVVVLLIGLLLGLVALASSPTLHLRFCPNANRPGHHCAATDFAAGLAEVPVAAALVFAVVMLVAGDFPASEIQHRAAPVFRLSPSRAPPSFVPLAG